MLITTIQVILDQLGVVVTLTDSSGNSTTTTTNNQGEYTFSDVVPGNYTVVETQPTDYANVSEVDGGDDGDNLDSSVLNSIPVIVDPGETDSGNDFVEEQFGSVTGNVSANTDSGIENLNGVTIQLRDSSDNLVQTTTTGTDGNYSFSDVVPGNYTVVELQPATYSDVSEVDGLNDGGDDSDSGDNSVVNSIPVIVNAGLEDSGNNFVEIENGSIAGNVSQDNDNDGDGEENLSGITITLEDSAGNVLTTTTDGDGNYLFEDVTPGDYTITQTNDDDFVDVTDVQGNEDDSTIEVTVSASQNVTAQDFVDEIPASIAGNVSRDDNNDDAGDTNLSGITVTLDDGAGNILTTTTDVDGNYLFEDVTPGNYTITQANDTDFVDVTDVEGAPDDSQVAVTVGIGETVVAQNFVDEIPASIAGNVSRDDNNDDAGDTNLSGITVTLDDGAGNILTTTTDVDGNYLFEDVTPGNYTITQANDTDFVDVTDVEGAPDDSQVAVTVGIGETVVAQNFVDEIPASIAGNVSRDDNNDDAGDTNLSGITVNLLDTNSNVVATTLTSANGNYLFEDVTPGNYIIEQINNPNSVDVTDVQGAPDDSQIAITVGIGQSVTAQNFVDEKVGSIAGIVTTDLTNNGTGDTGLAGVVLTLTDNSGTPLTNINGDNITATTNNQGEYIFTDVPPGDYRVVETQPTDYADVSETDGDNPNDGRVNSIDVSLSPEEASTGNNFVEIQLGEVTGRITADVDNNDTGDTGLLGVVVTLTDSSGNSTTTTTNNQGEYTFSDVVPGNYTVVETQPTDYANVSEVDGGDDGDNLDSSVLNSIPVIVDPGETDSGNDFVEEQFGSVTGNVSANTDSGIENLNGVTIQLRDSSDNLVQTTTTGTDGNYSFSDVVPGNYTVVELQPATYSDVSEVDGLNDGGDDSDSGDNSVVNSIPVIVNAGLEDSGNNFVEIENGSIAGNVSQDNDNDGDGEENLSGITITLEDSAGNVLTTTTDGDGNYLFEDVTPGDYTITQTNDDDFVDVTDVQGNEDDSTIEVTVSASQNVTAQDFVDEIPASIAGNVSRDDNNDDAGDTNLSGITVTLDDGAGNILTTTTDVDGNYLFEDVTPGNYTITQANDTDFVDVTDVEGAPDDSQVAVTVGIGETVVAQNFVDEIPASIAGNVSRLRDDNNDDAGDTNLSGITVTLDDGAGNILTTTTDVDGNYLFEDVTPGNYTITQANDTDFVDVTDVEGAPDDSQVAVTVGIGETVVAQNFVDEIPASIAGNVSRDDNNDDAGDTNLSGITVNLLDTNSNVVATTLTSANGNYLFEDVTPGNYIIEQINNPNSVDVTDVPPGRSR